MSKLVCDCILLECRDKRAICDAAVKLKPIFQLKRCLIDQDLRRRQIACGLCVIPHHPQQGYCQFKHFVVNCHLEIEGKCYQEFSKGLYQQVRAEEGETLEEAWLRFEVREMPIGYKDMELRGSGAKPRRYSWNLF